MNWSKWVAVALAAAVEFLALAEIIRVLAGVSVPSGQEGFTWPVIQSLLLAAAPLLLAIGVYVFARSQADDRLTAASWASVSILLGYALVYVCFMLMVDLGWYTRGSLFGLNVVCILGSPILVIFIRSRGAAWRFGCCNLSDELTCAQTLETSCPSSQGAGEADLSGPATTGPTLAFDSGSRQWQLSQPSLVWDVCAGAAPQSVSITNSDATALTWQLVDWPWWLSVEIAPEGITLRPSNAGRYAGDVTLRVGGQVVSIPVMSTLPAATGRRAAGFTRGILSGIIGLAVTALAYNSAWTAMYGYEVSKTGGVDWTPLLQAIPLLGVVAASWLWGQWIGGRRLGLRSLVAGAVVAVLVAGLVWLGKIVGVSGTDFLAVLAVPIWGLIVGGRSMCLDAILPFVLAGAIAVTAAWIVIMVRASVGNYDEFPDLELMYYGVLLALSLWVILFFGILGWRLAPVAVTSADEGARG